MPIAVLPDDTTRNPLIDTAIVALLTGLISTLIAHPLALFWWISRKPWKVGLSIVMVLPLVVGLLARNYSWIGMLSVIESHSPPLWGILGDFRLLFTWVAVSMVMIYIFVPFVFFIIIQSFTSIDTDEIDAAATMGATSAEILNRIILPRTWRQSLIAFLFVVAGAVGYFVTPRMIGGGKYDMIGNVIWTFMDKGDVGSASSAAMLVLIYPSLLYLGTFTLIVRWRRRLVG